MGARAEGRVTEAATGAWALRVPTACAAHAASLRLVAGVHGCAADDGFWLRGDHADALLWRRLQQLPGAEPFERLADGRIVRPGGRVPAATLPAGPWLPLAQLFALSLPTPALPAVAVAGAPLQLARGDVDDVWSVGTPALATTVAALRAWSEGAAELRYRGLTFVAAADGLAFVVGAPPPPVPGDSFVVVAGVALPAGHVLVPPCAPALVRAHLGLAEGDIAWFQPDGRCRVLPATAFVAMSRAALRGTAAELSS